MKCSSKSYSKRYLLSCALLLWTDLLITATVITKIEGFLHCSKEKLNQEIIWHINLVGQLKKKKIKLCVHLSFSSFSQFLFSPLLVCHWQVTLLGFSLLGMNTLLSHLYTASRICEVGGGAGNDKGLWAPQVLLAAAWDEQRLLRNVMLGSLGAP